MANYKAMTAFKKALAAPEDHFDIGTSFRSSDGIVITKLDEDLWVYMQKLPDGIETETLGMREVIATVRDSSTEWEVSHNWKLAKSSYGGPNDDDPPPAIKGKGKGKDSD